MKFEAFLKNLGVQTNQHIILHAAFKKIRSAFPGLSIEELLNTIKFMVTENGSLIMPAFTYCFKRSSGDNEIFDRKNSPSKVGAVSEVFRQMPDTIRTSSPTHSFILWGKITQDIDKKNASTSPLGEGSVMDWMAHHDDTFTLLLGVDFSSLSFCHYIETKTPLPWADFSPWDYMGVENIGVSKNGEQQLREIPGCSKSFVNFEKFFIENRIITPKQYKSLKSHFFPVKEILEAGLPYFRTHPENLLCEPGTCDACDSRWEFYLKKLIDTTNK